MTGEKIITISSGKLLEVLDYCSSIAEINYATNNELRWAFGQGVLSTLVLFVIITLILYLIEKEQTRD